MGNVPVVLLVEIMRSVVSIEDLRRIRSVNKTFHGLATPAVFKNVTVYATTNGAQGFVNLLNSPDVAKYVEDITLEEGWRERPTDSDTMNDSSTYEQVGATLKTAFSMLHQAPALRSLTLSFNAPGVEEMSFDDSVGRPSRFLSLQWDILSALAHNPNPLPALEALAINNWLPFMHDLYDAAPFAALVAKLRRFRFYVRADDIVDAYFQGPFLRFWEQAVLQRVLARARSLEELTMDSSIPFTSQPYFDFTKLAVFPNLRSLALRNALWEDGAVRFGSIAPGIEDFILRHGATLRKLELHHCTIDIKAEERTPFRYWAAVWNSFSKKLTALVDISVEWEIEQYSEDLDDPEVRYVSLGQANEYYPIDDLEWAEGDAPALEALKMIVKNRKKMVEGGGGGGDNVGGI
ncbi:hypothetical protein BC834DRAFT_876767 [Gloeopeniophorella convolvens]|nr:hypothetical protein BC834DRAFT_876767 [Gloeopeniophorella convolvens]